jgi:phosphopantothenoylcysteine decarboxylase
VSVQVVATNPSLEFYKKEDIEKTGTMVWTDADEWTVGLEA